MGGKSVFLCVVFPSCDSFGLIGCGTFSGQRVQAAKLIFNRSGFTARQQTHLMSLASHRLFGSVEFFREKFGAVDVVSLFEQIYFFDCPLFGDSHIDLLSRSSYTKYDGAVSKKQIGILIGAIMIINYAVIKGHYLENTVSEVLKLMAREEAPGCKWQPSGGLAVTGTDSGSAREYFQAMVLVKKE